jgi:hypothetical protein
MGLHTGTFLSLNPYKGRSWNSLIFQSLVYLGGSWQPWVLGWPTWFPMMPSVAV